MPFTVPATPALGASRCTDWSSRTTPPTTIRVYRVSEGFVETVDFKKYVYNVVMREWNVDNKRLRRAGAVAVKQYAWYHVLHYRGGSYNGRCYDVKDSTADQLYASRSVSSLPTRVKRAVNDTWSWRVIKSGKFIMTGYRRGEAVPCAKDAGRRLYARSARRCANQGWTADRILKVYYSASLHK
jgi:peptidoglycan hydrolase-like amidase